jgi:hypothetical protein
MTDVYEVRHEFVDKEDDTYYTVIGIFSTEEKAQGAIAFARQEPIFKNLLGDFLTYRRTLDQTRWDSGFFSWS